MNTDNLCGFRGYHPAWLQKYATSKIFLIVYGLLGTVQSMAFLYLIVVLTTLEKRFKIPSQTTGIILSGNEVSQILLSLILSYAGGQKNRPRWIAWGVVFCSASCFILALPHFMYGPGEDILQLTEEYVYEQIGNGSAESTDIKLKAANKLCSSDVDAEECDELFSVVPLVLIFLSQFVLGIGNTLYYSLGQSYLDDNTKKTNTPIMLACAMSLRLTGPVFGFIVGYFSLNIFIDPTKTPLINNKDPRWLGAWWIGWIFIGFVVLIFGILIGLFPKELPRELTPRHDLCEVPKVLLTEEEKTILRPVNAEHQSAEYFTLRGKNTKDFFKALIRLLRNKLLMFNILAAIFYILGASPYITFASKFMEVMFNKSTSEATIIVGPISIIALAIGFLSSGYFISKYKPTLRTIFLWNTFVGICVIGGQLNFVFSTCDNGSSAFTSKEAMNLTNLCNSPCSCNMVPYSPVCDEFTKVTYFSPCHAGCNNYDDKERKYTNCYCTSREIHNKTDGNALISMLISEDTHLPVSTTSEYLITSELASSNYIMDEKKYLVPGVCLAECTTAFFVIIAIAFLNNFLSGTAKIGNILLNFRVVSTEDKSLAQGLTLMFISLFALIPGPILFGYIIDSTCLIWNYTCESQGNCQLYSQEKFRRYTNLTAVLLTAIGVLFDVFIWIYGKNIDLFGDQEIQHIKKIEQKNKHVRPLLSKQIS